MTKKNSEHTCNSGRERFCLEIFYLLANQLPRATLSQCLRKHKSIIVLDSDEWPEEAVELRALDQVGYVKEGRSAKKMNILLVPWKKKFSIS